jgi:hypothetical protein
MAAAGSSWTMNSIVAAMSSAATGWIPRYGPASMRSRTARSTWVSSSVATAPGSTQHTRTPSGASSWRRASLNAVTPNLAALYTALPPRAIRPATDPTLIRSATPRGPLAADARRYGIASWVTCRSPFRFRSSMRRQSSSGLVSNGPSSMTPALLTRTSSRPNSSATRPTAARPCLASVMSAGRASTRRPSAASSAARSASRSSRRATAATSAPRRASRRTVAWPIPLLAPVTRATSAASWSVTGVPPTW